MERSCFEGERAEAVPQPDPQQGWEPPQTPGHAWARNPLAPNARGAWVLAGPLRPILPPPSHVDGLVPGPPTLLASPVPPPPPHLLPPTFCPPLSAPHHLPPTTCPPPSAPHHLPPNHLPHHHHHLPPTLCSRISASRSPPSQHSSTVAKVSASISNTSSNATTAGCRRLRGVGVDVGWGGGGGVAFMRKRGRVERRGEERRGEGGRRGTGGGGGRKGGGVEIRQTYAAVLTMTRYRTLHPNPTPPNTPNPLSISGSWFLWDRSELTSLPVLHSFG